jgi:transcription-repair coupling factor (superfamily II helicase)
MAYRPEAVVEEPGTFSRRGGLIDVFPPNLSQPVRMELFGDEIESLRQFDPATQRSEGRIEQFVLVPATEAVPRLGSLAARRLADLDLSHCHPMAQMEYRRDLALLQEDSYFRGIEFYLPFFYSYPATLLDYLPEDGLCVVDDWGSLKATVEELDQQFRVLQTDLVKAGELPANLSGLAMPYHDWTDLQEVLDVRTPLLLGAGRMLPLAGAAESAAGLARLFSHGERYGVS